MVTYREVVITESEYDALQAIRHAAEQVKRACFPDDRQAWTVQERRLDDALEALRET